jgi:glycosyltransferase involved in cell wall biosynthesis
MQPLISIIVPMYNVEKYLKDCLDSLAKQTYKNIEVLLINDGSPDSSLEIAKDYVSKYSNFSVYTKKNGGLSDARNYGMDLAKGEYFTFVDSDDVISAFLVENLYKALSKYSSKFAICKITRAISELSEEGYKDIDLIEGNFKELLMKLHRRGYSLVAAWGKLYHRSLFSDIKFPVGRLYEDSSIYLCILDKVDNYVFVNSVDYYYRMNEESITTLAISKKNYDMLKKNELIIDFVTKKHPEIFRDAFKTCLNDNDYVMLRCARDDKNLAQDLYLKLLDQSRLLSKKGFPFRKWFYKSQNVNLIALRLIHKIYFHSKIRNLFKFILE